MAKFKRKCDICFKNYVVVTGRTRNAVCYDCQKKQLEGDIDDPEMKKLFDIPEEFYKANSFLRDIKMKYLRFGKLSEKQIEVFRKVVNDLKKQKGMDDSEKDNIKDSEKKKEKEN